MTTTPTTCRPINRPTSDTAPANPPNPVLDITALLKDLLDKAADAQLALLQARGRADGRGRDEALLRLRATCLLMASVPPPDPDARRYAVLAAALLAAEDDDAASYARRMVEHAIELGDDDAPFPARPAVSSGPRRD